MLEPMNGDELKRRRESAGFSAAEVASVARFGSERLRAIERELSVEPETAERIIHAIAVLQGIEKRLARRLIGAATDLMREVAGVQ